jgi:hypothetical protein
MFLKRLSGSINAFLTECGCRWLHWGYTPVNKRKHGKANDSIRPPCYFMEISPEDLFFASLVTVLQASQLSGMSREPEYHETVYVVILDSMTET